MSAEFASHFSCGLESRLADSRPSLATRSAQLLWCRPDCQDYLYIFFGRPDVSKCLFDFGIQLADTRVRQGVRRQSLRA